MTQFASIVSYAASGGGRAWQGCATDGSTVWLISDRTSQTAPYGLQNNIDVFSAAGTLQSTQSAIYTGTDGSARLMNFVDGCYYNGKLWVCMTNWHSTGTNSETECAVLEINPSTWATTRYNITSRATASGSFESICNRNGEWWLCWSDQNKVFRYDASFNFIASYSLSQGATPYGGTQVQWFQGLQWVGDVLVANLHGANTVAEATYAPGVEMYLWNGRSFRRLRTVVPPVYGAGQGLCSADGKTWWFADRVDAKLVKCTLQHLETSGALDSAAARWHPRISRLREGVAVFKSAARSGVEAYESAGAHGLSLSTVAHDQLLTAIYEG